MRNGSRLAWSGLVGCLIVTIFTGGLHGKPSPQDRPTDRVPSALQQRLGRGEQVRVVIELRQPAEVQAGATSEEVALAIAGAQERFLARIPHRAASKRLRHSPVVAVEVDAEALPDLLTSEDVLSVRVDELRRPNLAQSVPLVGAPSAWNIGATGAGWTVAIVDTGVMKTHPFLAGKVVSEACYSTTSGTATSVCPGGLDSTAPGSGVNCSPTVAGCEHGTHIAGIAAGNGATSSGVAKSASIIAIQVYSRIDDSTFCAPDPSPCVGAFDSDILAGLDRVYALRSQFKIAAASLSLGSGSYSGTCDAQLPSYKAAIDTLRTAGIATIASSGNEGQLDAMTGPACVSTAISVGASDKSDQLAAFSNRTASLHFVAPSVSIQSPTIDGGFASFGGTSAGAAHVVGAWALVKDVRPTAGVADVVGALTATSVPVQDPAAGTTRRRINVGAAVQAVQQMKGDLPDFDGAHSADVLWRHQTPGTFAAWLLNGGTITGSSFFGVGPEWQPAMFGDVNGDGRDDIVWRSATTVALWFMNGTTLQGSTFFGVGPEWSLAAVGDLNSDGREDLVWRSPSSGTLVFWFMNGTAIIGTSFNGVGFEWDLVGVGDVDGNSAADLVWRNVDGTLVVWFMNGGSLQSTASFGIGTEWGVVGLGDLNGDGRQDILWRHAATGTLSVWLMDGGTKLGTTFQGGVGPEWAFVGAGDMNADGKADLIWRRPGTLAVWFMNGGTIQGSTFFGVGPEWTPVGAH